MFLVTGGTGFVGSHIVERLAERGERVLALDILLPSIPVQSLWEPYQDRIEFVAGDIRDRVAVGDLLARFGVTRVVHAATITPNAERELADPVSILSIGVIGTATVLAAAAEYRVQRFVYLSSASIYEPVPADTTVLDESAALRTTGLYPLTKVVSEWLAREAGATTGTETVSLRVAACYGPLERETGARTTMSPVWQMVRLARMGETIRLGTPDTVVDFTHVRDIAEGVCALALAPSLHHSVYNVSCGVGYSYQAVADAVTRMVPGASFTVSSNEMDANISAGPGARRGRLGIDRIRMDVGFTPAYDLEAGLAQYLDWVRRHPY